MRHAALHGPGGPEGFAATTAHGADTTRTAGRVCQAEGA